MDVLITGAAGYLGRAVTARLLAGADLCDADGRAFRPHRLILADIVPVAENPAAALPAASTPAAVDAPRCEIRTGSLADPEFVAGLVGPELGAVFHLAGIVSGAAEADFEAGLAVNLDGSRRLLEALRADRSGRRIRLVHASSIAIYGVPLPARIDDDTQPWPTLSYGMQKLATELLITDLSRRRLLDGRSLRLSGVLVRPPIANGALSGFNSDLIREPLAGRPIVSPVSPAATLWVLSLARTVDNLLHAMRIDADAYGAQRGLLLPAVAVSIAEIVDALVAIAGPEVRRLVGYAPDPAIEPAFGRWPKPFTATRARGLGFVVDDGIAAIIDAYRRMR
ncbi:MAG: NAD-dependent epimerase/dehydratase family protein [Lautropia sp.]